MTSSGVNLALIVTLHTKYLTVYAGDTKLSELERVKQVKIWILVGFIVNYRVHGFIVNYRVHVE